MNWNLNRERNIMPENDDCVFIIFGRFSKRIFLIWKKGEGGCHKRNFLRMHIDAG